MRSGGQYLPATHRVEVCPAYLSEELCNIWPLFEALGFKPIIAQRIAMRPEMRAPLQLSQPQTELPLPTPLPLHLEQSWNSAGTELRLGQ